MKKKRKPFKRLIILLILILLIPIPYKLKDGGSTEFKSILYTITKYHQLSSVDAEDYITGWKIEVLGKTIYDSKSNIKEIGNAEKLFNLKIDYIGDISATAKILNKLELEKSGKYTIELKTDEKPYALILNFDEIKNETQLIKNSIIILSLIDNLDEIHYTLKDNETLKILSSDSLKNELGNIKDYNQTLEQFETLLNKIDSISSLNELVKETSKIVQKDGAYYIGDLLIVNKSYPLDKNYNVDGLTNDVLTNFEEMKKDATELNLNLYISSGYKSYDTQDVVYNRYVSQDGKEIADTYSARPGHSEHQSGLAFDLNTVNDAFSKTDEGKWVSKNAYKYGFIIRYPEGKLDITGYKYESWHLRYVGKELASKLYNNGDWITLEEYFNFDSKYKN